MIGYMKLFKAVVGPLSPFSFSQSNKKMSVCKAFVPHFYGRSGDPLTEEQFMSRLRLFQTQCSSGGKPGVLFIGENHMDQSAHELELKILNLLAEEGRALGQRFCFSMEFFDRSCQTSLNKYSKGDINYEEFVEELGPRCPGNHDDYKPILDLAKRCDISVVASNCPREFTRLVAEHGKGILETLPQDSFAYLPPLPYNGPSKEYLDDFVNVMQSIGSTNVDLEKLQRRAEAQSLWDATMADSILNAFDEGYDFVAHVTGYFHVKNQKGIHEQLLQSQKKTSLVSLTVVILPEDNPRFSDEDHKSLADLLVLTDISKID
jgi:uncharacterized iron-regulated protein